MNPSQLGQYRENLAEACLDRSDYILFEDESGYFDLELHQAQAMEEVAKALQNGSDRFSVVHSCGSGKTVLESGLIQASQVAKANMDDEEVRRSKDLLLTTERSLFSGVRSHVEQLVGEENVGVWGLGSRENLDRNVIIATVQAIEKSGARNRISEALDPNSVSMVVGDEADRFLTPLKDSTLNQFRNAIRAGFTATESWPDGRHINSTWGDIVHRLPLAEGIRSGVNVNASYFVHGADIDGDAIPTSGSRRHGVDYQRGALGAAMKYVQVEMAIPRIYEDIILGEFDPKEFPTLVYVPSVNVLRDATERLQDSFSSIGLNVSSWSGDISTAHLNREIQQFQQGEIDILTLCEMGGRGLDLPRARYLIDAYPTLSSNKLEQRQSRVLRRVRPDSELASEGFQKPYAIISQILPRSTSFVPKTLVDVLGGDIGNVSPGGPMIDVDSDGDGSGGRIPEEVIRRVVRRLKSRPVQSQVNILDREDILGWIGANIPTADNDNVYYE